MSGYDAPFKTMNGNPAPARHALGADLPSYVIAGIFIALLLVNYAPAYANSIKPVGNVTVVVGDNFIIEFPPDGPFDACLVKATVTVNNGFAFVSGGGTLTANHPKFTMRAISIGQATIAVGFSGIGAFCTAVQNIILTVSVVAQSTTGNKTPTGNSLDPVNTFTGELFSHKMPDINLGGPMPLHFTRYYASYLRRSFILGDLGSNWLHNFDAKLQMNGNLIIYRNKTGRATTFRKNVATGTWSQQNNQDVSYKLVVNIGQDVVLYDPQDNRIYTFDFTTSSLFAGRLKTVADGKGNIHSLTYNQFNGQLQTVSDGLSRVLTFTYNFDFIPKISSVSDGTRSVAFQYTDPVDTENLTVVTDMRGGVTTYAYKNTSTTADHALMLRWTLPRLNVPFRQTYNATGQVVTQSNANGNVFGFVYAPPNTTITDPLSNSRVHGHTVTGELANSQDQAGLSVAIGSDASGRRNSITDRLGDITTVGYQAASGKLASKSNADGTSSSVSYAPRIVSGLTLHDINGVTHSDGTTETLVYDGSGNLSSYTDQLGSTQAFTYNGFGQVLTATNQLSGVMSNTYNADATLAGSIDSAGNSTTFSYDLFKRPTLTTFADGNTRSVTFDSADNPLSTTDENGNTTTLTYDANGNLATVRDALLNTTNFTYDGNDRLLSVTDPLGGISSRSYDQLGRVITTTDANGGVITHAYDIQNRLVSITDSLNNNWLRSYDLEAILASSTDPLGNVTSFMSDKMGRLTRTITSLGNITGLSYDLMGRVVIATDALNQSTVFTRDARGLISAIVLPGGAISTSYARNSMGQVTTATDPNGNNWNKTYDASGRLISSADPLNQSTTTIFDNLNRPSVITFPGTLGSQTLSYDGVGNLTGVVYSGGGAFGFTYDANNQMIAANNGAISPNNVTRAYDAKGLISNANGIAIVRDSGGRITSMTLAAGKTVTYTYDANDHLISVTDWLGGRITFTYDNAGRSIGIARPNGINTTNTWDGDSRLIGISEGTVSSIALNLDAKGQVIAATRNVPQPASASVLTSQANTFDAASQVSSSTFDALGRRTARGADSFIWDSASRLTSYVIGAVTTVNVYDAFGRRIRRTASAVSSDYVWNDALELPSVSIELRGGLNSRYFIHTPGGALLYSITAANNARSYYHYNEMGNTIFMTNDLGAVIGSYAYSPFGQLVAATAGLDNPFTWQGENGIMDEGNGLYYIRSRFYDSHMGRFISRDPTPGSRPKNINPYQYALNNPQRLVDATGRKEALKEGLDDAGGLTIAVIGTGLKSAGAGTAGSLLGVAKDSIDLGTTIIEKNGDVDAKDIYFGGGGALVADGLSIGLGVSAGAAASVVLAPVAIAAAGAKVGIDLYSVLLDAEDRLNAAKAAGKLQDIRLRRARIIRAEAKVAAAKKAAAAKRAATQARRDARAARRKARIDARAAAHMARDARDTDFGAFARIFGPTSSREAVRDPSNPGNTFGSRMYRAL